MPQRLVLIALFVLICPQFAFADGGALNPSRWWRAWNWDGLVLLSLGTLAVLYGRGLNCIWRKIGVGEKVRWWQAICFLSALTVIFVALISPLDALSAELSSMHMVQHMLLTTLAAPLFVLGSPTFVLAWGLSEFRRGWGSSLYRFAFRLPHDEMLWQPVLMWGLFATTLWVWHHPTLYQAALRDPLVHDAQHVSFFVAACLFWRVCLNPLGTRCLNPTAAIPYLFATSLHSSALGIFLALSPQAWYEDYAASTSAWGFTLLQDQQLAGFIMWMPACLGYPVVAAVLLGTWLARYDETARMRATSWQKGVVR